MKAAIDTKTWLAATAEEALGALGVDAATGLSEDEVRWRRERFGPNEIVKSGGKSPWRIL